MQVYLCALNGIKSRDYPIVMHTQLGLSEEHSDLSLH